MAWPQVTIIVMLAISVGISLAKHGETEMKTQNAWVSIGAISIWIFLLYSGNFWSN